MTRSTWLAIGIVLTLVAVGGAAWWVARDGSAAGPPPPPGAAASGAAEGVGLRVGAAVGTTAPGRAPPATRIAPLPSMIDPGLSLASAAERLVLTVRFDDAGPVTFDDRPQQLLGLREVDVDGRNVLAVISRDLQSGQVYSWATSMSFRVREGQAAADVLAGLQALGNVFNVFNFGDRIVAEVDPPAIPAVLRRLAQDGRVASYTLMRIEPRPRPQ